MLIEKHLISELNPAAYNPRKDLKPEDKEYKRLKKSIMKFDYVDPVIWNRRSGNVVSGHQRLKILIELGNTEIPVSVVDMDEADEKALNLQMNNNVGKWDDEKLDDILKELSIKDYDLELTGFDESDFKKTEINIRGIDFDKEIDYDEKMTRIEIYCNNSSVDVLMKKIEEIKKEIPDIIYKVKKEI